MRVGVFIHQVGDVTDEGDSDLQVVDGMFSAAFHCLVIEINFAIVEGYVVNGKKGFTLAWGLGFLKLDNIVEAIGVGRESCELNGGRVDCHFVQHYGHFIQGCRAQRRPQFADGDKRAAFFCIQGEPTDSH